MKTLLDVFNETEHGKVPAKEVSDGIREILKTVDISVRILANGLGISETQLNRMASKKKGFYRAQTLMPFHRAARLLKEARQSLTEKGLSFWLNHPHPYLNNLPPIMCLRSDQELDRVITQLGAMRYGFPA
jgi:uncharacterized protein (DUF2384 family)